MPLGLSPMTVSRTICLGFLAVITVGSILLMMPFSTSSGTWNDPSLLCSHRPLLSVSPVLGLSIPAPFFFWGQFLLSPCSDWGIAMTATTFLLLLLVPNFAYDKVAIQQALDRTGMHDSAQLIRSIIA